ncbi:MAG: D-alanyl-D-alanine carboxypeptidase [Clostridia bacterium]|nr:D-alanyl-D-alanine carboxypeptidase [Clostridia bacterium]
MDHRAEEIRRERHRRRQRRFRMRQRLLEIGAIVALLAVIIVLILVCTGDDEPKTSDSAVSTPTDSSVAVPPEEPKSLYPVATAVTAELGETVDADYAVLVDVTTGEIVAQKNPDAQVYPASVTKVMTLLVAVENATDMNETFKMSYTFLDPLYLDEATMAGFSSGEEVTVRDMLYGCILPSGADATVGLSHLLAGSEEAFATMMNAKAAELELKNTHFVNSSGLHNRDHYTTPLDMAAVMAAAMENPTCREVLSTYQYTTASTPQHPEGLLLTSTMFSRMYGDEPEGATIIAGKTGYTPQAMHTMVSYAEGDNGHDYIFVSMYGTDKWQATYDAINVLTAFCGNKTETTD